MSSNATVIFPDSGEPPFELELEKNLLIGSFLGCAAWGIHLCVYGAAMYFSFITLPQRQQRTGISWVLMGYMTMIFALGTTFIATSIQLNVNNYIIHRDSPGGPFVYAFNAFGSPMVLIGMSICPTISVFLTDALLIWRLYVIWRVYWGVYWILLLPSIMFLGSTGTGILLLFKSTQPGHNLNSEKVVHIGEGTAFWCISLSMTVIVTLLIVGRLVYIQRQTANILGNLPEYQDHYISAWTILLESSALYTAFGFVYLVLYNQNCPVNNSFDFLMAQVVCISSDLIILRVALGCGWTSQTSTKLSSVLMFRRSLPTTSNVEF